MRSPASLAVRYSRGRRAIYAVKRGGTVPFSVFGARRRFDDFTRKSIALKIGSVPFWVQNGGPAARPAGRMLCRHAIALRSFQATLADATIRGDASCLSRLAILLAADGLKANTSRRPRLEVGNGRRKGTRAD
jgi:hypothetical protein